MKKLYLLMLTLFILVGLIPQTVMAAEVTPIEMNLTEYLNQVSNTRGFEVTQEDVGKTLAANGMTIEDFNTLDEISTYLGDVIKADSSNLDNIYAKYYLDQTTLTQVLAEYGEELSDYIFINDLDMSLDFFTDDGIVIQEPDFDANLVAYLTEASSVRGFEVTIEAVELYLSEYDMTTDDFATVEELSDYLGDIIKADLSNLSYFDTDYEMNEEALLNLLHEEGKDIDTLVYMDQIESIIWSSDGSNTDIDMDTSALMNILSQFGVTEAELQKIQNHFLSQEDYFNSEEVQTQLKDIASRMLDFAGSMIEKGVADESYQPTEAEITELLNLYDEIFSVLKLKAVYNLISNGVTTQVTLTDLVHMKDLKDAELQIQLFSSDSVLLADFAVKGDELLSGIGNVINSTEGTPEKANNDTKHTVKGGTLPTTAGNYSSNVLIGLMVIVIGILIYRKERNVKDEILS